MELILDNQPCDLGNAAVRIPVFDTSRFADLDACREGRIVKIALPATPRNTTLASFACDPHNAVRFNDTTHTATLTADGATLLTGTARLLAASEKEYLLEIREGGDGWAHTIAQRQFNTLGIDYTAQLTPSTVVESWTADTPVRFFPIHRDEYVSSNNSNDLLPTEHILTVDDYHPFLHIATLVEQIFSDAGYRVKSDFLRSDFFQSLYMSGAYAARDTSAADSRMGFFARRLGDITASADSAGRVYADPAAIYNSLGNIVETATPQTLDADNEPIPELVNNGGCFSLVNGAIRYTPLAEIAVGFEYHLRYTTEHRILSRTRLAGFDSLYLGAGSEMRFSLANRYTDRRDNLVADFTYRAIVFDHADGNSYRLTCTRNGMSDSVWDEFETRSAAVTTPSGELSDPILQVMGTAGWEEYTGDWALYDGFVEEWGETTVDLRIRTASEQLAPNTPKRFNQIYLFGAEQGMRITLHKESSLRPIFYAGAGFGSTLRFADIACHNIRQSELIEALAHLFNLRFRTEEATRTVRIEPADDLFGSSPEADWRSKSDFSQPIVHEDRALDIHALRTWGYRAGDGAVNRFEKERGEEFGSWSVTATSEAALRGEKRLSNPLFAPTLNTSGDLLNAPSALLMQIGDRDDISGTAFTPRIVCYAGMYPLRKGEHWGSPSSEASYPLAAFHFAGDDQMAGFTLCFEDRDGLQGLNRFHRRQALAEDRSQHITLSLRIAPHEYEALFTPDSGMPDICSVFRIDTGMGAVRATLATIGEYNPDTGIIRCTFNRLIDTQS